MKSMVNIFRDVLMGLKSSPLLQALLIFGTVITISSCSLEDLPIAVQPAESRIAVASLVGPEELMFITLTKSFSALSAEDISDIGEDLIDRLLVDSALVTLSYNGYTDTLETFFGARGLYATQLQTFDDFQTMDLMVFDSTTSEVIKARSILQPAVELDSVVITRRDTTINFISDLSFAFDDPPNVENFYVMQIYQFTPPDTTSADSTQSGGLFFNDNNFLIYEQLMTDRGVDDDGRIRREALLEFNSPIDSALVVLTNIEEGYYNFLEARGRSGSFISTLANEPVNHPTNVENGVGYFSAHQPRAQIVVVGYYEE